MSRLISPERQLISASSRLRADRLCRAHRTEGSQRNVQRSIGYTCWMTFHAFVLGGGGMLGAAEVGMARALLEAGVQPELVCGTSVGAINGAAIAADPTPDGAQRLLEMWEALGRTDMFGGSLIGRIAGLVSRRTALHGNGALRRMLEDHLRARTFEDLAVPFECVAASVERAREHW